MTEHRSEFSSVLEGALSLSADDQKQLCAVLVRITGEPEGSIPTPVEVDVPELGTAQWLRQIQAEPPWTQALLLDDALARAEGAEERDLLAHALRALLKTQPSLAVRRAVVQLGANHPVGICLGAIGLVLAILAIGRGAGRLLF